MARQQIVHSSIPQGGITKIRSLSLGRQLEHEIAPKIGSAFSKWLAKVARSVALDWPRRSGRSAMSLAGSARVRSGATLDSIHGYFLVDLPIAANEYGTRTRRPVSASALAIPILDGVFPDGRPKRLGPNSWRSLGTFIYLSKNGNRYIAYRAGKQLKIVYLLVDRAKAIKELRKIRNMYDRSLPEMYVTVTGILQQAIIRIYNQQFIDALASIDAKLMMRTVPRVIPSADLHAERLTPRY